MVECERACALAPAESAEGRSKVSCAMSKSSVVAPEKLRVLLSIVAVLAGCESYSEAEAHMVAIDNPLQPEGAQFVAYLVSSRSRRVVSPEQASSPPPTPPVCISLCRYVFQGA